ncbi:MAG: beta-propeller fold lactonase family protein, partial [Deltaproteobacteria bacterium]|nr:beta-propeller fold lactonase family protein [Deltaproteobacteria bacterium]
MATSVKRSNLSHIRGVSFLFISLIAISLLIILTSAGLASADIQEDLKSEALPPSTPSTLIDDGQHGGGPRPPALDVTTWGLVTAPVYGTSLRGAYRGAELFAGPDKFGSYFTGVLPNGRIVKPAGISTQVGMNPLGVVLTLDGKYLITSNDDELDPGFQSYQNSMNYGCYSLSVIDTETMQLVSTWPTPPEASWPTNGIFIGLQVTGAGPYTLWASGGADNDVKMFNISTTGVISPVNTPLNRISITPITPDNQGFVTNYTLAPGVPPVVMFSGQQTGAQATWPAGSALSRNGQFLYVACNSDNSIAVIDTIQKKVVKQVAVGYFPYGVSLSDDDQTVTVSNWGVSEYKFENVTYDPVTHYVTSLLPAPNNLPDGFYVPVTNTSGNNPKTSSISILNAPGGDGSQLSLIRSVYQGHPIDELNTVGDTHPSATAILENGSIRVLYVTKTNSDSLGVIDLVNNQSLSDIDLSPLKVGGVKGNELVGAYPNAIVVSPDKRRMYVAEAGINSVAVLDTTNPLQPKLLGRMPTGWYPTALTLSGDGRFLYVANAKGVGTDINPKINTHLLPSPPSGLGSDPNTDSHCVFGIVQKINLASIDLSAFDVLANNYAMQRHADSSVVPIGGQPSGKIKHVFFILQENKTFDSMLGS